MSRPFEDLLINLRRSSRLVRKQKKLLNDGHVSDQDTNYIYEIAFLSAYVSFEQFIERQFAALLVGRKYYRGRTVTARVDVRSEKIARDLIKGTNRFTRFLPIEELEKLAKIYFPRGEPFTLLTGQQKSALEKGQLIRNVIAHRSAAAIVAFEKRVLAGVILRPSRRNPAGFLRNPVSPQQDRFEQMVADLSLIAKTFVE